MRPWDIFRQAAGCLTLLATFVVAMLFGYVLCWIEDGATPFIDKPTALGYAAEYARDFCSHDDHSNPANCATGPIKTEIENKDGWDFTIWSPDGKRSISVFVNRKGHREGEDPRDVDDPRWRAPDKLPSPAEAEPALIMNAGDAATP